MKTVLIICLLSLGVAITEAGECCNSYFDIFNNYVDSKWCDDYCCGSTTLKLGLYCCSESLLEAPDSDTDFCYLWWSHHVWAPVVGSIIMLIVLISCCVCCYKCCCSSRPQPVIISPGYAAPQASFTVQQSSSMNVGYDQSSHNSKY